MSDDEYKRKSKSIKADVQKILSEPKSELLRDIAFGWPGCEDIDESKFLDAAGSPPNNAMRSSNWSGAYASIGHKLLSLLLPRFKQKGGRTDKQTAHH